MLASQCSSGIFPNLVMIGWPIGLILLIKATTSLASLGNLGKTGRTIRPIRQENSNGNNLDRVSLKGKYSFFRFDAQMILDFFLALMLILKLLSDL